jgi:pilus assembly protein TadC
MSTLTELGSESSQARLAREIEAARRENRPISRRSLALLLVRERGLAVPAASAVVDSFCDEKAPYTPDYLSKEFMLPYLKLAALFFVVLSLVILAYAVRLQLGHRLNWPAYAAGAVLFLFSGFGLLQILRLEREG